MTRTWAPVRVLASRNPIGRKVVSGPDTVVHPSGVCGPTASEAREDGSKDTMEASTSGRQASWPGASGPQGKLHPDRQAGPKPEEATTGNIDHNSSVEGIS